MAKKNRDTDLLRYLIFKGIAVDSSELAENIQSEPHQLDGTVSAGALAADADVSLSDAASDHAVFNNTKTDFTGVIRGVEVIAQGAQNAVGEVLDLINKLEIVIKAGSRTVVVPAASCYRTQGSDGGTTPGASADGGPGARVLSEPVVFDTSKTSNTIYLRARAATSVTADQELAVMVYGPWADQNHSNAEDIDKGVLTPGGCDCADGPGATFVREAQSYGAHLRMG